MPELQKFPVLKLQQSTAPVLQLFPVPELHFSQVPVLQQPSLSELQLSHLSCCSPWFLDPLCCSCPWFYLLPGLQPVPRRGSSFADGLQPGSPREVLSLLLVLSEASPVCPAPGHLPEGPGSASAVPQGCLPEGPGFASVLLSGCSPEASGSPTPFLLGKILDSVCIWVHPLF